ncbi:MAG TPA: hypothetical protein VGG33_19390, partial [Polyangia bacterium]
TIETKEESSIRRHQDRERLRTSIDDKKRALNETIVEAERNQLLAALRRDHESFVQMQEGLHPPSPRKADEPRGMSMEQRRRLIERMAQFDMTDPKARAEWSKLKYRELQR